MEHVESTTTADILDGMVIEEAEENTQEAEVPAEAVAENLLAEDGQQEEAAAQEEEPAQEEEETPEEKRRAEVRNGVTALSENGWSGDELMTFSQDEQARRDIAGGMSVADAAMAYLRRELRSARSVTQPQEEPEDDEPPKTRKRGVPAIRHGASAGAREMSSVEEMDDETFARFSKAAQDAARSGKRVLIK